MSAEPSAPARAGERAARGLVPADAAESARPLGHVPFAFAHRFLVLFAFGLVWLAPAWWDVRFAWGLAVWDVLLCVAWVLDARTLPRPEQVRLRRRWSGPLALQQPVEYALELEHDAHLPLRVVVRDGTPAALAEAFAEFTLVAPAARRHADGTTPGRASARFTLRPAARGDHVFERSFVLAESPLRLAQRRYEVRLTQTVRVFPEFTDAGRGSLAAIRTRALEMERRRQRIAGPRRDFEALRDWRDGDDLRDVCWPATARRNRLVAKQWQAERSQTLWLVLDAGRLMGARTGDRTRLDVAVDTALRLARLAMDGGDRVGLMVYGRRVQRRVAPGRGRGCLHAILQSLAAATREPVEGDHLRAAEELLGRQRQRALIAWITDVPETSGMPDVVESASHVARRHLVMFLVMAHRELAAVAASEIEDVPGMYRRAAAQELSLHREKQLRGLRHRGAMVIEAEPGALAAAAINGYLLAKERSRL